MNLFFANISSKMTFNEIQKLWKKVSISTKGIRALSTGSWVALYDQGSSCMGAIKKIEVRGQRELLTVGSLMKRSVDPMITFSQVEGDDNLKKLFLDEIICAIEAPKIYPNSKKKYYIKDFKKVSLSIN